LDGVSDGDVSSASIVANPAQPPYMRVIRDLPALLFAFEGLSQEHANPDSGPHKWLCGA
jgi:hypothetical protein